MKVIQAYILIIQQYNENLLKNIVVSFFDEKLSFLDHIDEKIKKATVGVNLMHKLNLLLPRWSLLTVYKCFIRPHLDYEDVAYDQPNLSFLTNKIESAQYNATVSITGYRGTAGLLRDYSRNFYF